MINTRTSRLLRCGIGLLAGCWVLGWAVAEWLSQPAIALALWPPDINRQIGRLLGGVISVELGGPPTLTLGTTAVALRLALLMLFISGATWGQVRWRCPDCVPDAMRRTLVCWLLCCCWWPLFLLSDLLPPAGLQWWLLSSLPLWLMLTAAFTLWFWWQALATRMGEGRSAVEPPRSVWKKRSAVPLILLMTATVIWIGVSFWMNQRLYAGLLIPHGDSGMYEEHLWNVWHGKGFRSYLDQGLFLGEHLQVIHLLLLPLHMLWPSHLLLELAESVALGSCAIPLYRIALRHGGDRRAAAWLGAAWLLFFPMHFLDIAIDQKTFRPIALSLPFLFWMIDCAERRRLGWATLWLLVALSAKEDLALVTLPVTAVLAWRSRTSATSEGRPVGVRDHSGRLATVRSRAGMWWGIAASMFSAGYLLLAVLVVIPAFRAGDVVHYSRYFGDLGGSPTELLQTVVTDPLKVAAQVFSFRTLWYIVVFTAPLAFLPWRRPLLLCGGILTFGMLSLLQLGDDASGFPPVPYHHFHAPLLPVLFWATAAALPAGDSTRGWLRDSRSPRARGRLVFLACLLTGISGSMMPWGAAFWSTESLFGWRSLYVPGERAAMVPRVLEQIPADARVASTDYIHTRLTHRERSYDYSQYPRAVSNYEDRVPHDTDYIVIDTGHRYSTIREPQDVRELQREPENWELLPDQTNGWFIILKRRTGEVSK